MHYTKATKTEVDYILSMLGAIYPISEKLRHAFYEKTKGLNIKKGTVLLQEGECCRYMYFIKRGALMGQTTHQKKNIVTYISIDNEFVSSISGLHGVLPSRESIIAVEDAELLAMHNDDLQILFLDHFDLNFLFRVMVEQYYRDAQERAHIVRVGNVKERYLYFLKTKPGYMERLPLDLVASMLDMKPATLLKVQKQHHLSLQKSQETERWCREIENYIVTQEAFKDAGLNLVQVAGKLSVSPHRLSAFFNHIYGLSFVDFVNRQRILYIQQQMEEMRHYTIEALARDCGFASRSAFYSAFKKITGTSPARYRKSL